MEVIIRRIWTREVALRFLLSLERNDLKGAWRVRQMFESIHFGRPSNEAILCGTEHGIEIALQPYLDQGVEESIFRTGSYERGTLAVMNKVLKGGDRFVDVGANVGLMTLVAAARVGHSGRVDSFEPLPEIRALLTTSVAANRFSNVFVHDFALGSQPASLVMHRHTEVNRGSASLAWAGDSSDTETVRLETMDSVLPGLSSQPAAMIKIDVEGWELEVLRGGMEFLSRLPQPVLCVEFSRLRPLQGGQPEDMVHLLDKLGYEAFKLKANKSRLSPLIPVRPDDLPEHDNLFFFPAARLETFPSELFERRGGP